MTPIIRGFARAHLPSFSNSLMGGASRLATPSTIIPSLGLRSLSTSSAASSNNNKSSNENSEKSSYKKAFAVATTLTGATAVGVALLANEKNEKTKQEKTEQSEPPITKPKKINLRNLDKAIEDTPFDEPTKLNAEKVKEIIMDPKKSVDELEKILSKQSPDVILCLLYGAQTRKRIIECDVSRNKNTDYIHNIEYGNDYDLYKIIKKYNEEMTDHNNDLHFLKEMNSPQTCKDKILFDYYKSRLHVSFEDPKDPLERKKAVEKAIKNLEASKIDHNDLLVATYHDVFTELKKHLDDQHFEQDKARDLERFLDASFASSLDGEIANELDASGFLKDIFLNRNFDKLKSEYFSNPYHHFMIYLGKAESSNTLATVFHEHVKNNLMLPKGFFPCISVMARFLKGRVDDGSMSYCNSMEKMSGQTFERLRCFTTREEADQFARYFLSCFSSEKDMKNYAKKCNSLSFASIIASAKQTFPRFEENSWKQTFIDSINLSKLNFKEIKELAWALKMDIPLNDPNFPAIHYLDGNLTPKDCATFFKSLKNTTQAYEAFSKLYPLIVQNNDYETENRDGARLYASLKAISSMQKFSWANFTEVSKTITKPIIEAIKEMSAEQFHAEYGNASYGKRTTLQMQQQFAEALTWTKPISKKASETNKVVDNKFREKMISALLENCRDFQKPEDKKTSFLKLCTFYLTLHYSDRKDNEDRVSFLNEILLQANDEEIKWVKNEMWRKETYDRMITAVAATKHYYYSFDSKGFDKINGSLNPRGLENAAKELRENRYYY